MALFILTFSKYNSSLESSINNPSCSYSVAFSSLPIVLSLTDSLFEHTSLRPVFDTRGSIILV